MTKLNSVAIFKILCLFVLSRLVMLFLFVFAMTHYPANPSLQYFHYSNNKIFNYLGRWDTGWYIPIANNGYAINPSNGQAIYGFFPLYPAFMKLAGLPFNNSFYGGILASNIFLFLASLLLYLLCIKVYRNKTKALLAVVILYFFPASYLFSGVFSEAAFIFFSLLCVYFFEDEKYLLCGLSGFLLTLTRPFGILIIAPFAIRYLYKNGLALKASLIYLLLIPAGMLSFFAYCYFKTGDFLKYVHVKQIYWKTEFTNPLTLLVEVLVDESRHPHDFLRLFNACYAAFIFLLSVSLIKHVPFYLWLWSALLIAVPLQNGNVNIVCMPRYIVVCFPIMMALASFTQKNKIGWIWILLLTLVNFWLACLYSLGSQYAA